MDVHVQLLAELSAKQNGIHPQEDIISGASHWPTELIGTPLRPPQYM
jgi:hypothetical protein